MGKQFDKSHFLTETYVYLEDQSGLILTVIKHYRLIEELKSSKNTVKIKILFGD